MKRVWLIVLILVISLSGVTAASRRETPRIAATLTVYSTVSEKTVQAVVSQFEAETGITVSLVTAGAAELLERIEAEQAHPNADVLWGAALSSIQSYSTDLFMPYRTVNYDQIYESYRIPGDYYTPYAVALRCLLVNKNLTRGIPVTGYASILNPSLKGKISMVDPAASSSGYGQLANMLFDMGLHNDPNSDAAWQYVEAFARNLNGTLLDSSSAVWKGVCDGEYAVGLTYEEVSFQAVKDGYPVEIIYPREGAYGESTIAAIINGTENLSNAKQFIDFLTCLQTQQRFVDELHVRGIRSDLAFSDALPDPTTIFLANADSCLAAANKRVWLARFMELWEAVQYE